MIQAVGLTKRYGNLEALTEMTLTVAPGEIVALVGPNGAGKTTALKLLAGLLTPTRGDAWLGGHHVLRQHQEAKRLLAFLPDQPFLYDQLTVAETLGFIGGMYQLDPPVMRERANRLLATFGLAEQVHRRVGQLSYGMKSRLVLIASLLHDPRALVLDEPFFGLDPRTMRLMKQLLIDRAAGGMAVLLSTHQLSIVEDLAHRIAVLREGRIVALGSFEELQRQHGGAHLEDVFFRLTESSS
ncbi:MAG: ABC transporter ATP-binding protein [Candidatus Omnitrophica bacterium]|nr:ABC transporter ATP-binding protein [Candidatus Omnitrophota bacterium]